MKHVTTLRKVQPEDITELQDICREVYTANFATHWKEGGLEQYLEDQFGTERVTRDLLDKSIEYDFIVFENKNVGFLKLYLNASLDGFSNGDICELEKIYISPEYKGRGIGTIALNTVVSMIRTLNKKALFLCVLDTNVNSIFFYEKNGFALHSKTRLNEAHFKEDLKGMHRMILNL